MAEKETLYSYWMVLVGGRFYACRVPEINHYHRYTAHGAILVLPTAHEEIVMMAKFGPDNMIPSGCELVKDGAIDKITYPFDAFTIHCNKKVWEKVFAEKFST